MDMREQLNELSGQNGILNGIKRKSEAEMQAMHV